MNHVIQVRLGRKRAIDWKRFLKRTGLNQAELIREAVDLRLKTEKGQLPPAAARWCGKVRGPDSTATNSAIATMFRK
jgi:hypothetical protein